MRKQSSKQPISKRRSIAFFQPGAIRADSELVDSSHLYMFADDVRLHIMPIGGSSRSKREFSIEVHPPTSDGEKIIRYAFPRDGYVSYSVTEAISNFIEQCALDLAYKGAAFYEILKGDLTEDRESTRWRHEEPPEPNRMFLPSRIPGRVINLGDHYLQVIPRIEWVRLRRVFVLIPSTDVWRIEIPGRLGGRRGHQRMLRTLIKASTPLPKFVSNAMKGQIDLPAFDFVAFHKQQDLIAASETSLWGWPGREMWRDQTLEYYQFYRHVRFAQTMIFLREHILSAINALLERVSFPSRLTIKGLPSQDELNETVRRVARGEISFDKAWSAIEI